MEKIITAISKTLVEKEILSLHEYLLFSRDKYDIFIAPSEKMDHVLTEIGRLREITFREIAEGTGNKIDLDEYDQHYLQLFLWDRTKKNIVGGYRIGCGDTIIKNIGTNGLYISSLFFIKQEFYKTVETAIELGRSFITKEYQKERLPLFLMWKGILSFLIKNPHYQYIYGPVSISKNYSEISRSVIVKFIEKHLWNEDIAKYLKPKTPYVITNLDQETKNFLNTSDGKIDKLDEFISRFEFSNIKVPVLMKQYMKQNAKFVGFNLDPNFSDALDGFMILDISKLPPKTIEFLNWNNENLTKV